MRLAVVTNTEDPMALLFWKAYTAAGGIGPDTVLFLESKRQRRRTRAALEALLLFGPQASMRWWQTSTQLKRAIRTSPREIFPDTGHFLFFRTLNRGDGLEAVRRMQPDLLISVGSPEIFKPSVLGAVQIGALNVHNGLLPTYRGLFGTFWEKYYAEAWGYVTIHVMEKNVDAGAVLAQAAIPLGHGPLAQLLERKKALGGSLLAWTVRSVHAHGQLPPARPQMPHVASGYHSWPTLADAVRMRLRRGVNRPSKSHPAPLNWPPELDLGDTTGSAKLSERVTGLTGVGERLV